MSMRATAAASSEFPLGGDPSVWSSLLALVSSGPELEREARTTGALIRHRAIDGVGGLLRLALTYSVCNLSLKATAGWCRANGCASMSKWGVLNRLRNAGDWLLKLTMRQLEGGVPVPAVAGFRVHVVDASRLVCPGSKGEAYRLHAVIDPFEGRLVDLELTDDGGGEKLGRFSYGPGALVLGDRAYAQRQGLAGVVSAGADFLVRLNTHNVPLARRDGSAFDLASFMRALEDGHPGEALLQIRADPRRGLPTVPCRLVAIRKTATAADAARKSLLSECRKQKRQPKPLTLEACGYVLVLTSVDAKRLDASKVLALYRLRWQVELAFKRMKSLLDLDVLRARDPRLVKTTLAGKLLAVLLVDKLARKAGVAVDWSFTSIVGQALRQAILGPKAAQRILSNPQRSIGPMAEGPRARKQQGLATKALLLDSA